MKRMVSYFHLERFVGVAHQVTLLVITCTILSVLLYKPIVEFHPIGAKPIIKPFTQETVKLWGKKPALVAVGMHVTDFLKFDTVKNEFIINAFIWFAYDENAVKAEVIDKFYFTKGDIIQKSESKHTTVNGKTVALYTIRVQFSSILNYSRFPLDDHRLFLNLANTAVSADELIYQAALTDFIPSQNMYISGWNVVGHNVASGYSVINLGHEKQLLQNKTVFSLDLSKGDIRQLSLIFLPLLFLFYLGLFSFSIQDVTVAMTLPLASIAGLFAYSFVIQTLAPAVGYMMMSDYLFLFFLLSTFIIFFVKALAAIPESKLSRLKLKRIEGVTIVVLQLALVIVWFLLVDVRGV